MRKRDYPMFGSVTWDNGRAYFRCENTDNGFIFKDYEAYDKYWDAPCYVPDDACTFGGVTLHGRKYDCADTAKGRRCWYSHNDLLEICHYNEKLCDTLFDEIDWVYPETKAFELADNADYWSEFWGFVKPGAVVYWNDPAATEDCDPSRYAKVDEVCQDEEAAAGGEPWAGDEMVKLVGVENEMDDYLEANIQELSVKSPEETIKHSNKNFKHTRL